MESLAIQFAKILIESYKIRPKTTVIIVGLFLLILIPLSIWIGLEQAAKVEQKRRENLTYNQQIDALNQVEGSLENLTEFVELQKQKLKESEDVINNLKLEEEKLKPVVETNRKTIEALFELQNQRAQQSIWFERSIGFITGIVASLIASFIYGVVAYFIKRRKTHEQNAA